jgi:hypothetical protein
MDGKTFSRVEIIGPEGRVYVAYGLYVASVQDEGRTLKLFAVNPPEPPAPTQERP